MLLLRSSTVIFSMVTLKASKGTYSLSLCLCLSVCCFFSFSLSAPSLLPLYSSLATQSIFPNCCPIISDQLHRSASPQGVASPTVSQAMAVSMSVGAYGVHRDDCAYFNQATGESEPPNIDTDSDGREDEADTIPVEVVCLVILFVVL